MFKHHLITRSLAGGLVVAATGFPSAAQAMLMDGGGGPPRQIASGPPAPQVVSSHSSSFEWGDAGIGAAGATVLVGAGMLGATATRRRRRPAVS
jgi:hypothetical protein